MTLVKLDSGDYINTEYVIKTMTDTAGSVGEKGGQLVYLVDTGYSRITESDRNRIVEAMGGDYESRQMDDDPDYDELKARLNLSQNMPLYGCTETNI